MFLLTQMHPRAFYVFALAFFVIGNVGCDEKAPWYSGLQTVFKNCPMGSWSNVGQDDFLEKFRRCVQEHALAALDSLLKEDVIPVFDGLNLVRLQKTTDNYTNR